MDSGNSGSFQSSSGGDDEFDSRCGGGGVDSSSQLSALLRQSASPSHSVAGFGGSFYGLQELATTPPLPPLPQAVHHWSAALPAPGGGGASPSSSSSHGVPAASGDQTAPTQPAPPAAPRGSRKRTRASRRAPTTVLTTDTTNFRAMVQEFTGIPSPPFAGTPARSRFDHLFPSPSSLRSAPGAAANAASFPPYLLRPFAQKQQPSPFQPFASPSPSTSSSAPSNIAATPPTTAYASSSIAAVASGDSYQYHMLAPAPPSASLLGMRDHCSNYLSFESPVGAQLGGDAAKYPSHAMFDATGRGLMPSSPAPRLQDPADFLGLTHGILGSEGTHLHHDNRDHGHRDDELSGLVGGASGTGSGGGCKATYSSVAGAARTAPLLERNVESTSVGLTATATTAPAVASTAMRTQGVDSWICTSE